jgi:hypothetical protein
MIEEAKIFKELLKFKEFNNFINNEWENAKHEGTLVDWHDFNPSRPAFAYQDVENGRPFIELKYLPKARNDAFLVAHELMHVIRAFNGQCLRINVNNAGVYDLEEIIDLARRIGSMLDDVLIDSFLQTNYSFNAANFYIDIKIPENIQSLNNSGDPINDIDRLRKVLYYTQSSLQ